MTARDCFEIAWAAQRAHLHRASLAVLGVSAGVATVLVALSATAGAREAALDELGALGPDTVVVRATGDAPGVSRGAWLTPAVADAVARTVAPGGDVVGLRHVQVQVAHGHAVVDTTVLGVTSTWQAISRAAIAEGRWLDPGDDREGRRVVVLGPALARRLGGASVGPGALVRLNRDWYRVVGVLAPRHRAGSRAAVATMNLDEMALVPAAATPAAVREGRCRTCFDELVVRAEGEPRELALVVRSVLRRVLRIDGRQADAFALVVPEELVRARLAARRNGDLLLVVMGLLALVIGGIGTTNILLANVTERTAEIGLRRAVGATARDIAGQFGLEAVVLCTVGGLVGLIAGLVAVGLVGWLAPWPATVTPGAVALSLGAAGLVGVIAGLWPARRAAALTPVAALREE